MIFQCQVAHKLSAQACGAPADQIYVCEVIGPHDRHRIGEHTIAHALAGSGYACSSFDPPGGDYSSDLRLLAGEVNGFVYQGDRLNAVLDTVQVLRANPELAARLLGPEACDSVAVDLNVLDALREKYQRYSEDVGQAWIEQWGPEALAEVEEEKTVAGTAWLGTIHAVWPAISTALRSVTQDGP
jgi:hypothetical protein